MENNEFYVGKIYHRRKLKQPFIDGCVLYTEDNFYYLDLISGRYYSIDTRAKDYVIKDSLKTTDPSEYEIDYNYLLSKYKSKKKIKVLENN